MQEEDEWIDIGMDCNKTHLSIELPEPITKDITIEDIQTNNLIASIDEEMSKTPYNEIEYDIKRKCFVKANKDKYTPDCVFNTIKTWCVIPYWIRAHPLCIKSNLSRLLFCGSSFR